MLGRRHHGVHSASPARGKVHTVDERVRSIESRQLMQIAGGGMWMVSPHFGY
jgi:hypothetical protein